MIKTYVTFGQCHTHRVNGITFDCDSVAVIDAADELRGRERAFELFGPQFFTTYAGDEFDTEKLKYFPRGLIEVERVTK